MKGKMQVQPMAFLSISMWYHRAKWYLHFNIIPCQLLDRLRWQWKERWGRGVGREGECVIVCVIGGFLKKWNADEYKDVQIVHFFGYQYFLNISFLLISQENLISSLPIVKTAKDTDHQSTELLVVNVLFRFFKNVWKANFYVSYRH